MPAYIEIGVGTPNLNKSKIQSDNQEILQNALSVSDDQFNKMLADNISSINSRIEAGDKIVWNKTFVDTVIEPRFPDLYKNISLQNTVQITPGATADVAVKPASSGQNNIIFYHITYGVAGLVLGEFSCNVEWTWNNGVITGVSPDTYGTTYLPFVYYDGVVANQQYYINNNTGYYLYKEGKFAEGYDGINIYFYPWLQMYVYAGGSYSYSGGQ
jgi:hypothetical protein